MVIKEKYTFYRNITLKLLGGLLIIMSIFYTLEVDIVKRNINTSFIDIIESLIYGNWSLFSKEGKIFYREIIDDDDFEFFAEKITKNDYYKIIKDKKNISFSMFRFEKNIDYKIDIMIFEDYKVIISPDDKLKKMISFDLKILDLNWYLVNIIPFLNNNLISVESFSFYQHY